MPMFEEYIRPTDCVIDFGCGAGDLLKNIVCSQKIGIEINPTARNAAIQNGIYVVEKISQIQNSVADVVISNHALEHVSDPFQTILSLKDKLKPKGMAIFCVPCESYRTKFSQNDINQHLFTWAPANLGNLFSLAGYQVVSCRPVFYRWPPKSIFLSKIVTRNFFKILCKVRGVLSYDFQTIRIVAKL